LTYQEDILILGINHAVIEFWKSCNGERNDTELADWVEFATERLLTEEQIEEGEDIIGN